MLEVSRNQGTSLVHSTDLRCSAMGTSHCAVFFCLGWWLYQRFWNCQQHIVFEIVRKLQYIVYYTISKSAWFIKPFSHHSDRMEYNSQNTTVIRIWYYPRPVTCAAQWCRHAAIHRHRTAANRTGYRGADYALLAKRQIPSTSLQIWRGGVIRCRGSVWIPGMATCR